MHRIEGDNVDNRSGKNLFRLAPPFTRLLAEWLNAVQEEIANAIEQSGSGLYSEVNDTRIQLFDSIKTFASFDRVVLAAGTWKNVIERRSANVYSFKDGIKAIYFKANPGGYSFADVLSDGDTWGNLHTNSVTSLKFEKGAYINFNDQKGNLTVETDGCFLDTVDIQGDRTQAAAVTESFLLDAQDVTFLNCSCSGRRSNVAMVGFRGSSTDRHNKTSKYISCSVKEMFTDDTEKVIQPFVNVNNRSNCVVYDMDNTGAIIQITDPSPVLRGAYQSGSDFTLGYTPTMLRAISDDRVVGLTSGAMRTYKWDGNTHAQEGNTFLGITGGGAASGMGRLPRTDGTDWDDLIYCDIADDDIRIYRWDGTDWSQVGNDLYLSGIGYTAFAGMTSSRIAMIDSNLKNLHMLSWDGTDFGYVGNSLSFSATGVGIPYMARMSDIEIALSSSLWNGGNIGELRMYRFDGTDWNLIGNGLPVDFGTDTNAIVAFASLSPRDLVVASALTGTGQKLEFYRFDGQDWNLLGSPSPIALGFGPVSMDAYNSKLIVVYDGNDHLRPYLIDYELVQGVI